MLTKPQSSELRFARETVNAARSWRQFGQPLQEENHYPQLWAWAAGLKQLSMKLHWLLSGPTHDMDFSTNQIIGSVGKGSAAAGRQDPQGGAAGSGLNFNSCKISLTTWGGKSSTSPRIGVRTS